MNPAVLHLTALPQVIGSNDAATQRDWQWHSMGLAAAT